MKYILVREVNKFKVATLVTGHADYFSVIAVCPSESAAKTLLDSLNASLPAEVTDKKRLTAV